MALSNYTELQAAIRTELDIGAGGITDAAIVDAIRRAEVKINRKARLREMEQLAYATYFNGIRYLALPVGYLELLNLKIRLETQKDTDYKEVQYVAPFRLSEYYGEASDNGRWYYTLRDQIEFNREPASDHRVMMHYLKGWDIAADDKNWLLTNFPDVYLYGACAELEMHIRNDARIPLWKAYFEEGIAELNTLDERGRDDAELDTSEVAGIVNRGVWNIFAR